MRDRSKIHTTSCLLIPLTLLLALAGPAQADAPEKADESQKGAASLAWAPAGASKYTAWLRNAERWEAFVNSKAWGKLMDMPAVKDGLKILNSPDGPFAFLAHKQTREVLNFAGDLTAREFCLIAGENYADFLALMGELQGGAQGGRLLDQIRGQNDPLGQVKNMLRALNESRDKLKAPDMLFGFRLENAAKATAARKRLDGWFGELVESVDAFKGRLKKEKAGDTEWTTLTLDGSQVPWNDVPWELVENEAGEFKELVKKLKEVKVTASVGTRGDFVLVSLGGPGVAARLLTGKRLTELPELKPLAKFADRKLTSISYTSKALAAKLATTREDVEGSIELVESLLKQLPLARREQERIRKDLKELAKEVKAALPEPGPSLSFTFDTARGNEGYGYDWTRYPGTPEPRKLTLLEHLGGDPLAAFVGHTSSGADEYKSFVKLIKLADGYIDDLLLPKLEDEPKKQVEGVLKVVRPFLKQFDEITQKRTLPALRDGQSALVLDARLKSKEWLKALGETDKALPLFEPVYLFGVSDAEQLKKGLQDYRALLNETLKQANELLGVPEIKIPAAQEKQTKDGVVYWYPLGDHLDADQQLRLSAAIGPKVAAFGISTATTERLLTRTPLKVGGLLARDDRPLLSVSYMNCEGIVKALTPWAEVVTEKVLDQFVDEDEKQKRADIRKQVQTVLEVLTVFRSTTSISYVEDRAQVTHTEAIIRDLGK